jgi:hypothetical protein
VRDILFSGTGQGNPINRVGIGGAPAKHVSCVIHRYCHRLYCRMASR